MESSKATLQGSLTGPTSAQAAVGSAVNLSEGADRDSGQRHRPHLKPKHSPLRALAQQHPKWMILTAALLWATLLLPPLRMWFEASMFRHMILQLPLLAGVGWVVGQWLTRERNSALAAGVAWVQFANRWGATGLLLAIATMTIWMLPLALDNARLDIRWELAKFFSVPLLVGTATAMSWHRCPSIVRGVIHIEVIATFWRFGWGFLAIDERLCLSYLLGDQQRTGTALCGLGLLWALAAVWKPLFGAGRHDPEEPNPTAAAHRSRSLGTDAS